MKRSLIFFLCLIIICFFSKTKALSKNDNNYKSYYNLSTLNFDKLISNNELHSIKKICTDEICTYNLENNSYFLIQRHINNILKYIQDDEIANIILLKGIKINKIYFNY